MNKPIKAYGHTSDKPVKGVFDIAAQTLEVFASLPAEEFSQPDNFFTHRLIDSDDKAVAVNEVLLQAFYNTEMDIPIEQIRRKEVGFFVMSPEHHAIMFIKPREVGLHQFDFPGMLAQIEELKDFFFGSDPIEGPEKEKYSAKTVPDDMTAEYWLQAMEQGYNRVAKFHDPDWNIEVKLSDDKKAVLVEKKDVERLARLEGYDKGREVGGV